MAQVRMILESVVLDDGRLEVTFTFSEESSELPPPTMPPGSTWYGTAGRVVTAAVPIKPRTATSPTSIYSSPGPNNTVINTRVTWNGTAWTNPVRVDATGKPL